MKSHAVGASAAPATPTMQASSSFSSSSSSSSGVASATDVKLERAESLVKSTSKTRTQLKSTLDRIHIPSTPSFSNAFTFNDTTLDSEGHLIHSEISKDVSSSNMSNNLRPRSQSVAAGPASSPVFHQLDASPISSTPFNTQAILEATRTMTYTQLQVELTKALGVINEREHDLRLAAQIGEMLNDENQRLEKMVTDLTADVTRLNDAHSTTWNEYEHLRGHVDELRKQNQELMNENLEFLQPAVSQITSPTSTANGIQQFLMQELRPRNSEDSVHASEVAENLHHYRYTGDLPADLRTLQKKLLTERRQYSLTLQSFEEVMHKMDEDASDRLKERERMNDELARARAEADELSNQLFHLNQRINSRELELMQARQNEVQTWKQHAERIVSDIEQELRVEREERELEHEMRLEYGRTIDTLKENIENLRKDLLKSNIRNESLALQLRDALAHIAKEPTPVGARPTPTAIPIPTRSIGISTDALEMICASTSTDPIVLDSASRVVTTASAETDPDMLLDNLSVATTVVDATDELSTHGSLTPDKAPIEAHGILSREKPSDDTTSIPPVTPVKVKASEHTHPTPTSESKYGSRPPPISVDSARSSIPVQPTDYDIGTADSSNSPPLSASIHAPSLAVHMLSIPSATPMSAPTYTLPSYPLSAIDHFTLTHIQHLLSQMWSIALSLLSSSSSNPPNWYDNDHKACLHCHTQFSFRNRRHHCRLCGGIYCASCTSHRLTVDKFNMKQVRVCSTCFVMGRTVALCRKAVESGQVNYADVVREAEEYATTMRMKAREEARLAMEAEARAAAERRLKLARLAARRSLGISSVLVPQTFTPPKSHTPPTSILNSHSPSMSPALVPFFDGSNKKHVHHPE